VKTARTTEPPAADRAIAGLSLHLDVEVEAVLHGLRLQARAGTAAAARGRPRPRAPRPLTFVRDRLDVGVEHRGQAGSAIVSCPSITSPSTCPIAVIGASYKMFARAGCYGEALSLP
jgi:hypothetical protein